MILALLMIATPLSVFTGISSGSEPAIVPFAGGSGTVADPYIINNTWELQNMSLNLGANYSLGNDIDASNTSVSGHPLNNGGAGFNPVGNASGYFNGSLNGAGYTIFNLTINRSTEDYVGMFGLIGQPGSVSNVTLFNATINGRSWVGAIAGMNNGIITNVTNHGNVTGTNLYVGGIAGLNYGNITNATNHGNVTGSDWRVGGIAGLNYGNITDTANYGSVTGSNDYVGGITGANFGGTITNAANHGNVTGSNNFAGGVAGWNDGNIANSYNTGNIHAEVWCSGGIAGYNYGNGNISNSYNTGNIHTPSRASGGIAGWNDGNIANSYNTGNISANNYLGLSLAGGIVGNNDGTITNTANRGDVTGSGSYVGGIVGNNDGASIIQNSYNTGRITGVDYIGGLVGNNAGTIDDSYSTGNVNGTGGLVGGFAGSNTGAITDSFWDNQTSGIDTSAGGYSRNTTDMMTKNTFTAAGWDFNAVWYIKPERSEYPVLQRYVNVKYIITNVYELDMVRCDLLGDYMVANDFDASPTQGWNWNGTAFEGFLPIGDDTAMFTGSLDGGNHTISGLYIRNMTMQHVGLFGVMGMNARGHHVNIMNASVTGYDRVGALAGNSMGVIDNCSANGTVDGAITVGLLVGYNNGGYINDSYSSGTVSGTSSSVGGIAGYNTGTITNAANYGNVTGSNDYVGGIAGYSTGTISNAVNYGNVTGSNDYVGGIAGYSTGTITNATNYDNVTGLHWFVGGIVGYSTGTITNATNYRNLTSSAWNVGGIAGSNTGTITNTINYGNLIGTDVTYGGIVGSNSGTITNATNYGDVTGSNDYVGGIAGSNTGIITNAANYGNVTGSGTYAGGITGYAPGGTITNTANYGNVTGSGDCVGGIVGSLKGAIMNTTNYGDVTGSGNYVGGITGRVLFGGGGPITNATNHGDVTGSGDYVGGIAGRNVAGSSIETSYNMGQVTGTEYTGGGIGLNEGTVTDTYSQGAVSGGSLVGGLVGNNTGTVDDSYSSGKVNGTGSDVGGFAGSNTGTITDSFWDNQTSGQAASDGGIGKNTTEMKSLFTFTGAGWDFANVWAIRHTQTYPFFGSSDWNNDPTAGDDSHTSSEDSVLDIPAPGVLANDEDVDEFTIPDMGGYDLSVTAFDNPSAQGAVVNVNADGAFTYDPTGVAGFQALAVGEYLLDTFAYTVSDDLGGTDTAIVTINVTGVNDAPTANDDFNTINEDTVLNVAAPGVLANDTDPDTSDVLSVVANTFVTINGAVVTINADGSYTYNPTGSAILQALAVGEYLVDNFTYTITDGNGGMDTATVSINVTGVNDDPTAADDLFNIQEDSGASALSVLVNDIDADGSDIITITDVTQEAHGTVVITGGGTGLTYEPDLNYSGTDTFTYNISDGNGGTDTAAVTVIVNGTNDAPVISTVDDATATEDVLYSVDYEATDVDLDVLTWSLATNASWLNINTNSGVLSGLPTNADVGSFWVNVSVSDGNGGADWTNFTLTVSNTNDAPAIITMDIETAMEGILYSVDYNASDIDQDVLAWNLTTDAGIWLSINGTTGVLNGTPSGADAGSYWVNVSVIDGNGGLDWHNFTLEVLADTDGDGIPNTSDDDDDNDGWNDTVEELAGTDPQDANDMPGDEDSDGIADFMDPDFLTLIEYNNQTVNQTVYSNSTVWNNATADLGMDSDSDGWNDIVEILAGTDPLDDTDMPEDADDDGIADFMDPDGTGAGEPETITVTETPAWAWGALIAAIVLGMLAVMGFMGKGGKPESAEAKSEEETEPELSELEEPIVPKN